MGHIRTAATVIFLILTVTVLQLVAISVLSETHTQLIDNRDDPTDVYSKEKIANDIYEIVVLWVPFMADAGILAWGFARAYRQQRVTGAGVPRR